MLEVRKTAIEDLDEVEKIFIHARKQMAINGNPAQWGDDRPSMELVKKDIAEGNSYVILNDGKITATFVYIIGSPCVSASIYTNPNVSEYDTIAKTEFFLYSCISLVLSYMGPRYFIHEDCSSTVFKTSRS